jgi:hypothetical protein
MQKVVGSSPIIRSEIPANEQMSSSDQETMAAAWLHFLGEISVNSLRDLGFLHARKCQRHPGRVTDCPANQAIPVA